MQKQIHEQLDGHYNEMVSIRRHLHQHPELSFQETKTAAFIADYYEKLGIPYEKNVGGNGVVATLKGGKPGKTVALRADFDALPIQDEKDVEYKSTVDGVMHACGHDGHTATLLVLAKVLTENKDTIPGT
ncbi:MAG TPA: M20/M25/M40 family metallo-hydrolase, partial [Bacillota bacterium]|nr:M20/M25/M40 family metallo-hydrolase [Bacillota bacterium]